MGQIPARVSLEGNDEDLLTTAEVAGIFRLTKATLIAWRQKYDPPRGPRPIKVGHQVRYRRGDVRAFLEERAS